MSDLVLTFQDLQEPLKWLLEHIYILLLFWYKQIKGFFKSVGEHFKKVDETLIAHSTILTQHNERINNLERS